MKLGSLIYIDRYEQRSYGIVVYISPNVIQIRKMMVVSRFFNEFNIDEMNHYNWSYSPSEVNEV